MKKIKTAILNLLIWGCNKALSDYREGASDQTDVNGVVAIKNDCLKMLAKNNNTDN